MMAGYPLDLTTEVKDEYVKAFFGSMTAEKIREKTEAAMAEIAETLKAEVIANLPFVRGTVAESLEIAVYGEAYDVYGEIRSPLIAAKVLETGAQWPGPWPPRAPIEAWCEDVLGDGKLWYVVARAIKRRGLPARHIFSNALNTVKGTMRDTILAYLIGDK